MFLKKKTYNDLVARVEKLAKENEDLISKYEGKINADLNLKEYKKEVDKKAEETVEAYKKALDSLLEKDLNYTLLKQMVNSAQKGTVIDVKSDKGYTITIRQEIAENESEKNFYNVL